jgi:hypothetical protein
MKTIGWVGLIIASVCLSACATTYSGSEQRAVVGTVIGVLIVGAAVHSGRDDARHLQEEAQPDQ